MSLKVLWLLIFPIFLLSGTLVLSQDISIVAVASGLNNPRGVAVMSDGRLLVIEAGLGEDIPEEDIVGSGTISIFEDLNIDGDYDDVGERTAILTQQASYNTLNAYFFSTGHDQVIGLNDIALLENERIFYTHIDPFRASENPWREDSQGGAGVFELDEALPNGFARLVKSPANINALAYDPQSELFFIVESGANRLMSLNLEGEAEVVASFDVLAHNQQAVPAGLSIDSQTGDVLVALFSGFVWAYAETPIGFMPSDSKIVRFNPTTGRISDEITGLTTAVDVATDPHGNLFVVEMTTTWPSTFMPDDFNLHDPTSPPDPGGYVRFTGRVTMYPANGSEAIILADRIDTPTNITYANGKLYISSGLGTPRRTILAYDGSISRIEGVIYEISGFN